MIKRWIAPLTAVGVTLLLLWGCEENPITPPEEEYRGDATEMLNESIDAIIALSQLPLHEGINPPGFIGGGKGDTSWTYIYGMASGAIVTDVKEYIKGLPFWSRSVVLGHAPLPYQTYGYVETTKKAYNREVDWNNDIWDDKKVTTTRGDTLWIEELSNTIEVIVSTYTHNDRNFSYTFQSPVINRGTGGTNIKKGLADGRVTTRYERNDGTWENTVYTWGGSDGSYTRTEYPDGSWEQTRILGMSDGSVLKETIDYTVVLVPYISSLNPISGSQGQTLDITVTGNNLSGVTQVEFRYYGSVTNNITVNSYSKDSDTQMTVNATISASAPQDEYSLWVLNINGEGDGETFDVAP